MNFNQHLKSKCLIVEASTQSFSVLSQCLKKQGVTTIERCHNLRQALDRLEVEFFPWIITSTFAAEPVNILQLMSVILKYPALRTSYVSLLYKPDEIPIAIAAMELGLLSCFPSFENKNEIEDSLSDFWRKEAAHRSDTCALAAEYLSTLLVDQKLEHELLYVRQKLVDQFPGHMEHILRLAECEAMMGDIVTAASTLVQIKMIAPSLHSKIEEIHDKYLPQVQLIEDSQKSTTNVLGIHKAVIVDPDDTVLKTVIETLEALGAKGVETFTSPEEALEFLKDRPDLDILIHEWKMPKISGPIFVQRVRHMGLERTPVILCSSQVADRDQHLTRELGIATIVPKPFKKKLLLESIIWTMKQEHRPTEIRIIERKIQGFLSRNKLKKAQELVGKLKIEKKLPEASLGYFEAELLFFEQKYDSAKFTALESLRKGFSSVRLYHLMGKILMKLGDFEAAVRFLEKAQDLSPHHVMRLCLLADAQTELGDLKASRATLDQAAALDPQSKSVLHSELSLSLTMGELKKAEKIFQNLDFFDEIVSYLNNRAVALSRGGRHAEAIDCYNKALQCLPSKANPVLGSLYYNLSLAQIRALEHDAGLKSLKISEKMSDENLHKKVQSLRQRLQKSIQKKEPFALRSADTTFEKDQPESRRGQVMELLSTSELGPGDYALYKIFVAPPLLQKTDLSRSIPRFNFRATVTKEASFGLEKMKA